MTARTAHQHAHRSGALMTAADLLARTVTPLLLALAATALIILGLGADPLAFYADVLRFGIGGNGWQQTLTAMAPLLLVALGLIVAFRAGLWNLGSGGSYLLTAAVVTGMAPQLYAALPYWLASVILFAAALGVGILLAIVPAYLKVRHGTNEIVTTLMMSFIAIGAANLLVRGLFHDPAVPVPQTRVLALDFMLPYVPGTQLPIGIVIALLVVVFFHYVLTRSAFGLQIDMLGANPRAAAHAGVDVRRLTVQVLMLSGALVALAAAVDMLGLWGYLRAEWNPAYGDKILPFVFLARLSPLGSIPLVGFYALLATGGTMAAQRAGLSVDVLLVIVALVLVFMVIIEFLGARIGKNVGRSYLPRTVPSSARARGETR